MTGQDGTRRVGLRRHPAGGLPPATAGVRGRRRAALLLGTAAVFVTLPLAAADASAPVKAGWWNVAAFGGAALPMPTTAAGDLHLGQGPSGPTAYAAVAYRIGTGVAAATLEFKVTSGRTAGTPALQVCPTKDDRWKAAADGPITDAPAYDCSRGAVTGLVAADGATVTFLLNQGQLSGGTVSLAVVPTAGSQPFQLDLSKPGPQSFTAAGSVAPAPPSSTGGTAPGPAPAVAAPPAGGGSPVAPAAPAGGGVVGLNPAAPALPGPSTPVLAAPTAPAPQTAPAPNAAGVPAAAFPPAPVSNRDRYVAGSLLALIAGALVWAGQNPGSTPRLLGGMAPTAGHAAAGAAGSAAALVPRGIGRFAAVRTAPARRLL